MILDRIGKDSPTTAMAKIACFPPHSVYYDVFFGAGGTFFQKPLCPYNWANDRDGDVINLFEVLLNQRHAFKEAFDLMPLHEDLFNQWRKNHETDPVRKALRFIVLSNFSLFGKFNTFHLLHSQINRKVEMTRCIEATYEKLRRCMFRNLDFRKFFKDIIISEKQIPANKRFIYADCPFLGATSNYAGKKWTKKDADDLFKVLKETNIRFMVCEYNHPHIMRLVKKYGLQTIQLEPTHSIKSKRQEILITNYKHRKQWFQTALV
jgi:DNA adenine methylase